VRGKNIYQHLEGKELPLSFRSVKTVAATKNTIEIATQKCYKQQHKKYNKALAISIYKISQ